MKNLIQSILTLLAVVGSATVAEDVIYVQVGEELTLKAPLITDSKLNYMYWYFNGKQLAWANSYGGNYVQKEEPWAGKLSLSGHSLVIRAFPEGCFGTFDFRMDINKVHTAFTVAKLNASKSPSSPLLRGEDLSLSCTVQTPRGHRTPDIYWEDPQGKKSPNNQVSRRGVSGRENGEWTCVVVAQKTEKKAKLSVVVIDLAPAPSPQYTSVSSPLVVPCSLPAHVTWTQVKARAFVEAQWLFFPKLGPNLISNVPQRLFHHSPEDQPAWKKDQSRGLTPHKDLDKGQLSLSKRAATEDDRGNYTCELNFKNGVTLSRTVQVEVLRITSFPGTQLVSGQHLDLDCTLGRPLPPDMRVKWIPPESSSSSSSSSPPSLLDLDSAELNIPAVGRSDEGSWRCELWRNGTRLTTAQIALKIEPVLSVWMLVMICSVSVIVLLLLIVMILLYRRRQMKQRHRHFCRCKNPKPKGVYTT